MVMNTRCASIVLEVPPVKATLSRASVAQGLSTRARCAPMDADPCAADAAQGQEGVAITVSTVDPVVVQQVQVWEAVVEAFTICGSRWAAAVGASGFAWRVHAGALHVRGATSQPTNVPRGWTQDGQVWVPLSGVGSLRAPMDMLRTVVPPVPGVPTALTLAAAFPAPPLDPAALEGPRLFTSGGAAWARVQRPPGVDLTPKGFVDRAWARPQDLSLAPAHPWGLASDVLLQQAWDEREQERAAGWVLRGLSAHRCGPAGQLTGTVEQAVDPRTEPSTTG